MKNLLSFSIILLFTGFFHACTVKAKDTSVNGAKIIKLIEKNKNIFFKDIEIDGDIDFTQIKNPSIESSGTYRVYVQSSITFVNCTFNGKIIAYSVNENKVKTFTTFAKNLSFQACTFKKEIIFSETAVEGIVNFSSSTLEKLADFQGFNFKYKDNYFTDVKFKAEAKFQRISCYGNINFKSSVFNENVSFQKSLIKGNFSLGATTYEKYADFSSIFVLRNANFNYAKFNGKLTFNNSLFNNKSDFNNVVFNKDASFKKVQFRGQTRFNETKAKSNINFDNAIFSIEKPNLESIKK